MFPGHLLHSSHPILPPLCSQVYSLSASYTRVPWGKTERIHLGNFREREGLELVERRLRSSRCPSEELGGFIQVPVLECTHDSTGTQGSRQLQVLKVSPCLLLFSNEIYTLFSNSAAWWYASKNFKMVKPLPLKVLLLGMYSKEIIRVKKYLGADMPK